MAPVRRKTKKRAAPKGKAKVKKVITIKSLPPIARLRLVEWDAYERPAFFKKLLNAKGDIPQLTLLLKKYLLTPEQVAALSAALIAGQMTLDFTHCMKSLHIYTVPRKGAREKVLEMLLVGREEWCYFNIGVSPVPPPPMTEGMPQQT